MSWGRLDDSAAFHPKVLYVGNSAWGAFTRLISKACEDKSDGFVSEKLVKLVCSRSDLKKLLSVGPNLRSPFLERTEGGYQIHDFHVWNPSAEEVEQRRLAKVEAGRLGGLKKAQNGRLSFIGERLAGLAGASSLLGNLASKRSSENVAPSPSPSPSHKSFQDLTPLPPEGEGEAAKEELFEPESAEEAEALELVHAKRESGVFPVAAPVSESLLDEDPEGAPVAPEDLSGASGAPGLGKPRGELESCRGGAFGFEASSFADGIRAVTGKPCTVPRYHEARLLGDALQVHGRAELTASGERVDADTLCAWMRSSAEAFARQTDAQYGGYTPKRFVAWLDSGKPAKAERFGPGGARRALLVQPEPEGGRMWKMPEGFL